jgi:hypothetical protein
MRAPNRDFSVSVHTGQDSGHEAPSDAERASFYTAAHGANVPPEV